MKVRALEDAALVDALINAAGRNGFGFLDGDIGEMRAEILDRMAEREVEVGW